MQNSSYRPVSLAALVGGIGTSLFKALQADDIIKTMILAATGSAVSFIVSVALKRWSRYFKK